MDKQNDRAAQYTGTSGISNSSLIGDVLACEEFIDVRRSDRDTPERTLMRELLMDALRVIRKGVKTRSDARAETLAWFRNDDDDGLFSVRSICLFLGIDLKQLRRLVSSGTIPTFSRRRAVQRFAPVMTELGRSADGELYTTDRHRHG